MEYFMSVLKQKWDRGIIIFPKDDVTSFMWTWGLNAKCSMQIITFYSHAIFERFIMCQYTPYIYISAVFIVKWRQLIILSVILVQLFCCTNIKPNWISQGQWSNSMLSCKIGLLKTCHIQFIERGTQLWSQEAGFNTPLIMSYNYFQNITVEMQCAASSSDKQRRCKAENHRAVYLLWLLFWLVQT